MKSLYNEVFGYQEITRVNVKRLNPEAKLPSYAKPGDAAMDLTATSKEYDDDNKCVIFGTGLALEIPFGHVGLIFPRSSVYKTPLMLSNAVGVVDSQYRGEVKVIFKITDRPTKNYEVGDRVAQLMIIPIPFIEFYEVETLSETERGTGGHGSTGK